MCSSKVNTLRELIEFDEKNSCLVLPHSYYLFCTPALNYNCFRRRSCGFRSFDKDLESTFENKLKEFTTLAFLFINYDIIIFVEVSGTCAWLSCNHVTALTASIKGMH